MNTKPSHSRTETGAQTDIWDMYGRIDCPVHITVYNIPYITYMYSIGQNENNLNFITSYTNR